MYIKVLVVHKGDQDQQVGPVYPVHKDQKDLQGRREQLALKAQRGHKENQG
jgi:hypothetical protein